MSTNSRRGGNRSSIPSRGGMRRSNTPPPPSTKLGINGLPEGDPISTSRPRGLDLAALLPVLDKPPADLVADAKRAEIVPPPSAKVPPVEEAKEAREEGRRTLPSNPGPAPTDASEGEETSATSPSRAPVPGKRKGRAGNKKTGKTTPPPATTSSPPKPTMKADNDAEAAAPARALATREEGPKGEAAKPSAPPAAPLSPPPASEKAPDAPPTKSSLGASIPPSAEFDQRFFDHGERAAAEAHAASLHDGSDLDNFDEKLALKNSPEAIAKRALFGRYVMIVVAVAAVVGLVGVVRSRAAKNADQDDAPVVVTVVPPQPLPTAAPPPVTAKADPSAAAVPSAVASAPAASGSAVAAGDVPPAPSGSAWAPAPAGSGGAPVAGASSAGTTAGAAGEGASAASGATAGVTLPAAVPGPGAEPTVDEKKEAAKDKRACQSLLDQGAFAKAVAAGEKSVSLDPTDGEAWLLLGAAYQAMGKAAEARRTFSSCVAEGKRGPISECRSMLR